MIRVDTKSGHGAGKPTAKIVSTVEWNLDVKWKLVHKDHPMENMKEVFVERVVFFERLVEKLKKSSSWK